MTNPATEALSRALANKVTDPFAVGDVVRWVSSDRYIYAAVKTSVGWFTTARGDNRFVEKQVDYEGLVEILSTSDTADIMVASAWEQVGV